MFAANSQCHGTNLTNVRNISYIPWKGEKIFKNEVEPRKKKNIQNN